MDRLDSMSWDDVRVFLCVVRGGTVRRGAASLGTSHSTVLRRIDALEKSLGVRLFHRRKEGYVLTPAGERVRDIGIVLEDRAHEIRREVQDADSGLRGDVRVALPDALLPLMLGAVPRFEATYPNIRLELVTSTRYVDLRRGDADVAVRIAHSPDQDLVGRRVMRVGVAVYGSRKYARRVGARSLAKLDWLSWERGANNAFTTWIDAHVKASQIRLRVGGIADLERAIDADLGVTLMPAPLGATHRTWRCFRRLEELGSPVWVLSHPDLRTTARVRAVRDFIADALSSEHDA